VCAHKSYGTTTTPAQANLEGLENITTLKYAYNSSNVNHVKKIHKDKKPSNCLKESSAFFFSLEYLDCF
jgi:hypothetical protein